MQLKRRKTKSNTPIVFAVPKAESNRLKQWMQASLKAFKEGHPTPTDWHNVGFRLKVGVEVAKVAYVEENVIDMQQRLNVCKVIQDRFIKTGQLTATSEELDLIETGIEAVDVMQDNTIRRILLDAHHTADRYMKSLAKSHTTLEKVHHE